MTKTPDWARHKVGRDVVKGIKRHGYTLTAALPEPSRAGYTYSVGLTPRRLPELLIPDMPGNRAAEYLQDLIDNSTAGAIAFPREKDTLMMSDGTFWEVQAASAKSAEYTVTWALRLYGDRFRVRVLHLLPPSKLGYPKFSPWPSSQCVCGCTNENPLAGYAHQVGSRFVG